jgi:hypothetical protein
MMKYSIQCPREGGASVYRAREILLSINPNSTYNDDAQCNVLLARKKITSFEITNDLSFFADKQNCELKFINKLTNNENCIVIVYDAIGRIVLNKAVSFNQNFLSIPFVGKFSGVFLVKIVKEESRIENFKFVW